MSMTKPVLLLDFGGVISKTLFETHRESEAALGLAPHTLNWYGPFNPQGDELWQRMQQGEISERDYWLTRSKAVGELLGENWTQMQTLVQRTRSHQVESQIIRPEAVTAIEDAKKAGYGLAILSNELDLFYGKALRESLRILEQFDHIIDATYTGLLKPSARAYEHCLITLDLTASQVVFVDDQARNVEGARALGITAVQFDVKAPSVSFAEALRHLADLLD